MPTITKPTQPNHIEPSKTSTMETPTTVTPAQPARKSTNRPEYPVFLESSMENIVPSTRIESTETLSYTITPEQKKRRPTSTLRDSVTKVRKPSRIQPTRYNIKNNTDNGVVYSIVTKVESSVSKSTQNTQKPKAEPVVPKQENIAVVKEMVGTVVHEVIHNGSTTVEMKPKEVWKFHLICYCLSYSVYLNTLYLIRIILSLLLICSSQGSRH